MCWRAIGGNLGGINPYALGLGLTCQLGLFVWPRLFATKTHGMDK